MEYDKSYDMLRRRIATSQIIKDLYPSVDFGAYQAKFANCQNMVSFNVLEELKADAMGFLGYIWSAIQKGYLVNITASGNQFFFPTPVPEEQLDNSVFYHLITGDGRYQRVTSQILQDEFMRQPQIMVYNLDSGKRFVLDRDHMNESLTIFATKIPFTCVSFGEMRADAPIPLNQAVKYMDKLDKQQVVNELTQRVKTLCENLQEYTFTDLMAKRTAINKQRAELSELKNPVLNQYDKIIYERLLNLEQSEALEYMKKMPTADYNTLKMFQAQIETKGYSSQTYNALMNELMQKILMLQAQMIDNELAGFENMDRNTLHAKMKRIEGMEFEKQVTEPAFHRIRVQIDFLEQSELQTLCGNIEISSMEELNNMLKVIAEGNYQQRFSEKYIVLIHNRIDFLFTEIMKKICENVFAADRSQLFKIREEINSQKCEDRLKLPFFDMIMKREEELDYNELIKLTENVENCSMNELEEIDKQVRNGSYSPKVIKEFIMKIRLQKEKIQHGDILLNTENIESIGRNDLEARLKYVDSVDYPEWTFCIEKQKLKDKIFEYDMKKLLELCDDFDNLKKDEIEQIYQKSEQLYVSDESKKLYQNRLEERRMNYCLEQIQGYAQKLKAMAQNYNVDIGNIKVATFDNDYVYHLNLLKQNTDKLEKYEIPVFIMAGAPYIACTLKRCFYVTDTGLNVCELEDIHSFTTIKGMLFDNLGINMKNGNTVVLPGNLSKRLVLQLVYLFNEFMKEKSEVPLGYSQLKVRTTPFNPMDFCCENKNYEYFTRYFADKLIKNYRKIASEYEIQTNMVFADEKDWMNKEVKAKQHYGISMYESLVCFTENSVFSSSKDGIAIGQNYVFVKKPGNSLITIPIEQVYRIGSTEDGMRIQVETIDNCIFIIECINMDEYKIKRLRECLDNYVRAVQFVKQKQGIQGQNS